MTKEDILKKCVVTEGNVVKLPSGQLSRELYTEVAKALELIGGKWKGGKVAGFVFKEDPTEYLEEIAQGIKRNVKKEFQFYGTPDSLADKLVDIAELRYLANYKTKTNISILEPSAGQGAIVRAINRILPSQEVDCYELMPLNRSFLKKIPTVNLIGEDFLSTRITQKYDVIIANPPFSKNQDITHVRKMYEHLKPNGILVAIMSTHWKHTNNKVEREFRAWLDSLSAEVQTVASGEFKESGTMVQSVIVSFRKKASTQEVKASKGSTPAEKVYENFRNNKRIPQLDDVVMCRGILAIITKADFAEMNPYTIVTLEDMKPVDDNEIAEYVWEEYISDHSISSLRSEIGYQEREIDNEELRQFNPNRLFFIDRKFYTVGVEQRNVGYRDLLKLGISNPIISKYHNIDKYYSIPNVYKALLSGLSKYLPS